MPGWWNVAGQPAGIMMLSADLPEKQRKSSFSCHMRSVCTSDLQLKIADANYCYLSPYKNSIRCESLMKSTLSRILQLHLINIFSTCFCDLRLNLTTSLLFLKWQSYWCVRGCHISNALKTICLLYGMFWLTSIEII